MEYIKNIFKSRRATLSLEDQLYNMIDHHADTSLQRREMIDLFEYGARRSKDELFSSFWTFLIKVPNYANENNKDIHQRIEMLFKDLPYDMLFQEIATWTNTRIDAYSIYFSDFQPTVEEQLTQYHVQNLIYQKGFIGCQQIVAPLSKLNQGLQKIKEQRKKLYVYDMQKHTTEFEELSNVVITSNNKANNNHLDQWNESYIPNTQENTIDNCDHQDPNTLCLCGRIW